MFCPQCGTENNPEQKYCRRCGQQVTDARIALRGGADDALKRYQKGARLLSIGSLFLLFSVLAALANSLSRPGPRNYAVIINLLIGLVITGPLIVTGMARLRCARRALRLKDEPGQLAGGHSPGEETFAASAHPTARLLERVATPGSITEGTTRHLQAQERKR
ncbi:MAG TPA: zinc ribbon domain-containing protein [Pyrinomonadaceae bacterium]|nr:zinc ribbon domain-containing protein [Pyrinomonadaceae bacterium]